MPSKANSLGRGQKSANIKLQEDFFEYMRYADDLVCGFGHFKRAKEGEKKAEEILRKAAEFPGHHVPHHRLSIDLNQVFLIYYICCIASLC